MTLAQATKVPRQPCDHEVTTDQQLNSVPGCWARLGVVNALSTDHIFNLQWVDWDIRPSSVEEREYSAQLRHLGVISAKHLGCVSFCVFCAHTPISTTQHMHTDSFVSSLCALQLRAPNLYGLLVVPWPPKALGKAFVRGAIRQSTDPIGSKQQNWSFQYLYNIDPEVLLVRPYLWPPNGTVKDFWDRCLA